MVMPSFSSMRVTSSRITLNQRLALDGRGHGFGKFVAIDGQRMSGGNRRLRAISISSEPARRISSFSSQGAVFSVSDFSEFEHTSSAKFAV